MKNRKWKNQKERGQMTIEAVLILTLMVSLVVAITSGIKEKKYFTRLVEKPWVYVAGMIENGYWGPVSRGKGKHPNHPGRHGSPIGDSL